MTWWTEFARPTKAEALEKLDAEIARSEMPESVAAFLKASIDGLPEGIIYVRSSGHLGHGSHEHHQTQTTEVRRLT